MAVIFPTDVPFSPRTSSAYCASSLSPVTVRGSIVIAVPATIFRVSAFASDPSAKRYQRRTRLVAVSDWIVTGVDQPFAPPRFRVTFGRKMWLRTLVVGCAAQASVAVVGRRRTTAATRHYGRSHSA